ncbi:MAG: helix-turn-helix domain-containing protein [Devosia sp.]|nr:helix-turn-helix domain-containing protein [Devosia sp.]
MEQLARNPSQIGAIIRRHRKKQNLTQTELGEKTHTRQATISGLESGKKDSQLKTLTDLLAALNLELVIRERSRAPDDFEDEA